MPAQQSEHDPLLELQLLWSYWWASYSVTYSVVYLVVYSVVYSASFTDKAIR
jgi:hypothetical protein